METNWMQSGLFADNVSGERRVRIRFYGSASGWRLEWRILKGLKCHFVSV
ncbi:hypothetical protein [Bacteroides sp. ET225]|nr:hypothetical protein [Bacteroides sp. ET225]MCR8918571.1 hypothetical protein [Bacteroides sp. ET225]